MKRKISRSLSLLLAAVMLLALIAPAALAAGSADAVYLRTAEDLVNLSQKCTLDSWSQGKTVYLEADIDLTGVDFAPTAVMTSDKFVYLFGRVIPALSLVLSMTLRFVPKFKAQLHVVSEAQRCVGRDISDGGLLRRTRNAVTIFSIMVTWTLENAIETADSMKSRGYGLPGRTAFSIYRFDVRDRTILLWLCFCGLVLGCGAFTGCLFWRYYPTVKGALLTPLTACLLLCWTGLCLTPMAINIHAYRTWRTLHGKEAAK